MNKEIRKEFKLIIKYNCVIEYHKSSFCYETGILKKLQRCTKSLSKIFSTIFPINKAEIWDKHFDNWKQNNAAFTHIR